jgi:hypothetical protein
VTNQATRIIVRAVGELAADDSSAMEVRISSDDILDEDNSMHQDEETNAIGSIAHDTSSIKAAIDYTTYRPKIDGNKWILSETDLCKIFYCAI